MDARVDPMEMPVLRVAVLGEDAALAEFGARLSTGFGWPTWSLWDPDELRYDVAAVHAVATSMNRLFVAIASRETSRSVLAAFDADVLVLAATWRHPTQANGPARMYGRQVFPRAAPVLWLGANSRPTQEERTLRGTLRAFGLSGDDAPSVWSDLDPRGEHFAHAIDRVIPGHPREARGRVREVADGTWFVCAACGEALTRGMHRVGPHPAPQSSATFRHNRRMFPGGGVYALGVDADGWGRAQRAPGAGPAEVALLDARDMIRSQCNMVPPSGGGCCGMIPVGEMNLACACGARVGYVWSECAMYAVDVLRLDRVRARRAHPK